MEERKTPGSAGATVVLWYSITSSASGKGPVGWSFVPFPGQQILHVVKFFWAKRKVKHNHSVLTVHFHFTETFVHLPAGARSQCQCSRSDDTVVIMPC